MLAVCSHLSSARYPTWLLLPPIDHATWQDCADGGGWADAVDSIAARWHGAARLLLALWQEILNRIPQASSTRTDHKLHCLDQKVAEVRALWWAFEGDESKWAAAESASGFHACRGLLDRSPTLQLDMEINGTTSDGLGFTLAQTGSSSNSTLRYQLAAVYTGITDPDAQRSTDRFASQDGVLILGAVDAASSAASTSGRLLSRQHWHLNGPVEARPVVVRKNESSFTSASTLARRQIQALPVDPIACTSSSNACDTDVWCNTTSGYLEVVGIGFFSLAADCIRHPCSTIETQLVDTLGRPASAWPAQGEQPHDVAQYTSSGNGDDACEWVCSAGGFAREAVGNSFQCLRVDRGEFSLPMSNAREIW